MSEFKCTFPHGFRTIDIFAVHLEKCEQHQNLTKACILLLKGRFTKRET